MKKIHGHYYRCDLKQQERFSGRENTKYKVGVYKNAFFSYVFLFSIVAMHLVGNTLVLT